MIVSDSEEFYFAVRLVVLDIENVLKEIDGAGLQTRRGVENLFESQLAALKHVGKELETKPLSQRLRALTQATVGVLPPLLNSVERSNGGEPIKPVSNCRLSIDALRSHL